MKVGILMGSTSDESKMSKAKETLEEFGIESEWKVLSAHRNPDKVVNLVSTARENGFVAFICGAGMAAHLAGAVKANTILPVIGVPLPGGMMDGLDSLLSAVQMPKGVPVATTSVGKAGAINAAILSAEILALNDNDISDKLLKFKSNGATLSGI